MRKLLPLLLLGVTTCLVLVATQGAANADPPPGGDTSTRIVISIPGVPGVDPPEPGDPGDPSNGALIVVTFEHGSW